MNSPTVIRFEHLTSTFFALWKRAGDRLKALWGYYVATLLLTYTAAGASTFMLFAMDEPDSAIMLMFAWSFLIFFLGFFVPIGLWSTIKHYQSKKDELPDDEFDMATFVANSPGEQLKQGVANALNAIPISIALALAVTIGSAFVIIPGIIASVLWWMAPYYAAAWDTGFSESFRRAAETTKKNLGTMIQLWLSTFVVAFAFSFVIGFVQGFFLGLMGDFGVLLAIPVVFVAQVVISFLIWAFYGSAFTSLADPSSIVWAGGAELARPTPRRAVREERTVAPEAASIDVPPKAVTAAAELDAEQRLERLDKLLDKGLLTEDEYLQKREEILETL